MVEISAGLKKLAKRDLLPDGEYRFKIDRIGLTKNGNGEGAFLVATKAPEQDLVGKKAYLYLLNMDSGLSIGLTQLLASLELLEVPSGEFGENNTQNLTGLEFDATVTTSADRKTQQDRNNVNPSYDSDWLENVRNMSEKEFDAALKESKKSAGSAKKARGRRK